MTEPHLSADTLADLQEGLLDDDGAGRAEDHLAGCAACRADRDALAGLPAVLAASGAAVGALPPDVAARLDHALAGAAAEPAGSAVTRTVTPLHPERPSRPRGLRALQAAAVLVLVLAGGAVGVSALQGHGGSAGSTSSRSAGSASAPKSADLGGYPVTASGQDWTKQTVTAAVPRLIAGTVGPVVPSPQESGGAGESLQPAVGDVGRLAGGADLAGCLSDLTGGPAVPLAVDLARFEGQPAAVIVLPGLAGPGKVDVYVVAPDCAPGKGTFLYYASVPRP